LALIKIIQQIVLGKDIRVLSMRWCYRWIKIVARNY